MTLQSTDPSAMTPTGRPTAGSSEAGASGKLSWVAILFLLTLPIPVYFSLGTLRLSPVRILLVAMFIPLVVDWIRTRGFGKFLFTDFALWAFSLWVFITLMVNHGTPRLEFAGITTIELMAPYLLARKYIRTSEHFRIFVKVMFILMMFIIPAAISEAVFRVQLYKPIFELFGQTFYWRLDPRMGMWRAQTGFEHPILFGVFCSTTFALFYFSYRSRTKQIYRLRTAWASVVATFFSLSVGAYIGVIIQIYLMIWNWLMRNVAARWYILTAIVVAAYVVVDLLSNRTPFEVFISYLTFNSGTAYWRVLIFRFAIDDVMGSPIFGIGLGDWTRPSWMHSASVDNYWLLMAMRYGLPGFVLSLITYISALSYLMRCKNLSETVARQRLALTFVLVALGVSMCTVHLWGTTFIYFCFLLGAGAWITTVQDEEEDSEALARQAELEAAQKAYPYARPVSALGLKDNLRRHMPATAQPLTPPSHSRGAQAQVAHNRATPEPPRPPRAETRYSRTGKPHPKRPPPSAD